MSRLLQAFILEGKNASYLVLLQCPMSWQYNRPLGYFISEFRIHLSYVTGVSAALPADIQIFFPIAFKILLQ